MKGWLWIKSVDELNEGRIEERYVREWNFGSLDRRQLCLRCLLRFGFIRMTNPLIWFRFGTAGIGGYGGDTFQMQITESEKEALIEQK